MKDVMSFVWLLGLEPRFQRAQCGILTMKLEPQHIDNNVNVGVHKIWIFASVVKKDFMLKRGITQKRTTTINNLKVVYKDF